MSTDRIVLEYNITYPWKTVGFKTPECNCMAYRVSCNCEDFKVVIRIKETQVDGKSLFIAELINQPYNAKAVRDRRVAKLREQSGLFGSEASNKPVEKTQLRRVNSSTASGNTVVEAYMAARARFLNCKCKEPENELYDLGYPRQENQGFWNTLLSLIS